MRHKRFNHHTRPALSKLFHGKRDLKSSKMSRRLKVGTFGFAVVLIVGSLLLHSSNTPTVLSSFVQNDWSSGSGTGANQYASGININDSTPGQLTIVNNNISNWCNSTPTCDASWTRRQQITLKNNGDAVSSQSVLLFVTYKPGMNSDFSDLRFTDSSGTVLQHYLLDKTDSQNARIWLKTGSVSANGTYAVYMYFGNSSASSTSNTAAVVFEDGFDLGNYDNWTDAGGFNPAVSNGAVTLNANQPGFDWLLSKQSFSPAVSAKQVIWDMQYNGIACNNSYNGGMSLDVSSTYYDTVSANATDCNNKHRIATRNMDTVAFSPDNLFSIGQTYTFKTTVNTAGEHDYFYSLDRGKSFTRLSDIDVTTNATTGNFRIDISVIGANFPATMVISNLTVTDLGSDFNSYFGLVEHQGGKTGLVESRILDAGAPAHYDDIEFTTSGSGDTLVQVRTSPNSDMSGASEWYTCPGLESGDPIDTNNACASVDRYAQYSIALAADSGEDFQLNSITLNYRIDSTGPNPIASLEMRRGDASGAVIASDGWINQLPYASWPSTTDIGDAGMAGYCAYVGTNSDATLQTTAGMLSGTGPLEVGDACAFATANTYLPSNASLTGSLTTGTTYYIKIAGIDTFGNVGEATTTQFRFDNSAPSAATLFSAPTAVSSKIFTVSWLTAGGAGITDFDAGPAGFKYCVTSAISGFDGCDPSTDNNYYGLNHSSGRADDPTDVIPASNGQITTVLADADRLDDVIAGANAIFLISVDNAGNYQSAFNATILITQAPGQAPENLQVNPTSSTNNAFSFTWDPPTSHVNAISELNYCWTVNEEIQANGSNCNWTGKGIEQLASGPYATMQGDNIFRIATDDVAGNFDGSVYESITFTANTTAPGAPNGLDISDVSTRSTSSWKLALTWAAPTLSGSGVSGYRVYRSTDNSNFSQVGSTSGSNTSFIDSGLSQVDYYYKVVACDNAASCGAASNVVTLRPTGRFTEPAALTADTDQPKIKDVGTKKTTVYWFTDRDSDSKVAFGTSPGQYGSEEVGNSSQVSAHSVTLTNLQPNTTYYYVAKWTDRDGNTGQSSERTFTTTPPPAISEVAPVSVTANAANIGFRAKDASKVIVYYGRDDSFGGVQSINTASRESSYAIPLRDLTDGARYVFKINGLDSDGNEYQGNTYSFTTPARPRINNLRFQPVANEPSSTMEVTWNTNVPATSELSYGPSGGSRSTTLDSQLVSEHKVILRNLADDTEYSLVASSHDKDNNVATSDTQTFRTALDTRPPQVSDVVVETAIRGNGSQARGQIIVTWKTDEPASSQVAFGIGQGATLTNKSSEDNRLTTEHTVVVSELPTSSIFTVAALSTDKGNNTSTSESITAIIGRGSENVFNIIFDALQRIFGL